MSEELGKYFSKEDLSYYRTQVKNTSLSVHISIDEAALILKSNNVNELSGHEKVKLDALVSKVLSSLAKEISE